MNHVSLSGPIGRHHFQQHQIPIPDAIERATTLLIPAPSGKWHVPGGCRYAREHAGQSVPLLEVRWGDLCGNCAPTQDVDPLHTCALRSVATLSEMSAAVSTFAEELTDPGRSFEWLDYARRRAGRPITDESLPALTAPMRGVHGWARTVAAVNRAALEYSRQFDALLAQLAERLDTDSEDGLLDRAIDIVATETPACAESEQLQRITLATDPNHRAYVTKNRGFDAWTYVADLWLRAHRQGTNHPDIITARAKQSLAERLPHVRDLTQLPTDPKVAPHPADTPQSWADRVLAVLRDRTVTAWIERAEMTLHSLRDAHRTSSNTEPDRALLVTGWPLHHDSCARLAYLSQYPTLLAPLRIVGSADWQFPSTETCVAILRVPESAAEQAHAISSNVRSTVLAAGTDPLVAASRLLRDYGVVVHPIDLPPATRPSRLVESERTRLATAITDTPFQAHPRPFTHGADLPPHVHDRGGEWTPWTARAAFHRRGSVFIPGIDDLERFALGFVQSEMYDTIDVQVRLQIPAGTPPHIQRYSNHLPAIANPPTRTETGLIDVPAILHGLTDDHTTLLLEIHPCRDPIPVPLTYIALLQYVR
ncbi:hypothetical protein [Nocardia abscessus]|uniref:hypothetical protein n=1 Tax=Nocardia abscessus TaxID=120957 RepID=UPI0024571C62|nr:hypothetical protein [Nocardia abscessus]